MGIKAYLRQWKDTDALFYPLIWFICGSFVILKGSITHLVRIEWVDIDVIPILLIYLVAQDQNMRAGPLAFFMGILTDMFAPCQLGLFAFVYSAILVGINHCRQFLDFSKIKTSVLLVAIFVVAKWCLLLVVISIFPLGQSSPSITFAFVSISALGTSLIAPFLFYFLTLLRGEEEG